jgi:peptidoglycan/LPS O-acetylase OafA/YrhL
MSVGKPILSAPHQRTFELDGVRGWACLSVIIAHCVTGLMHPSRGSILAFVQEKTLNVSLGGVDLFFVLSGFLIGGILIDSKDKPNYFSNFWIRRIGRIFPVAYLLLATYCVALWLTQHLHVTMFDDWVLAEPRPPLWTFATFTQSIPIAFGGFGGPRWMAPTWSLAIEEQFYFIFPFAVYFLSRRNLTIFVIAGLIFAPLMRDILLRVFGYWYAPYVLLPSRVDNLMFGVGVALIVRNRAAIEFAKRWQPVLDAIAFAILVAFMKWMYFNWWPLNQTLMALMWAIVILRIFTVERSIFNRIWLNRTLAKIGLISYALYMYHQAVNGLFHQIIFGHEPRVDSLAEFAVSIAVMATAIGLATLSYRYYEKPIRTFAQDLAGKRSSDGTVALREKMAS